jgi:hypothetical protein
MNTASISSRKSPCSTMPAPREAPGEARASSMGPNAASKMKFLIGAEGGSVGAVSPRRGAAQSVSARMTHAPASTSTGRGTPSRATGFSSRR